MRLFICTDHDGHYPGGTASIAVAPDKAEAERLLKGELAKEGLDSKPFTLSEVDMSVPHATVLRNGDY